MKLNKNQSTPKSLILEEMDNKKKSNTEKAELRWHSLKNQTYLTFDFVALGLIHLENAE